MKISALKKVVTNTAFVLASSVLVLLAGQAHASTITTLSFNGTATGYDGSSLFFNSPQNFPNGTAYSTLKNSSVGGGQKDNTSFQLLATQLTAATATSAASVPEPTTVALLGLGLLGFAASRRKAAKK